jgi:oxygen-independent coproporphyrinogen III oxidase
MLNRAGYIRYEISNYCRPGYASRHNTLHWTGGHYVGLGPSAQSYVGGKRVGNVSNLAAYNQALLKGALPLSECERLTPAEDSCERLVFGLRLTDGVSLEDTGSLAFSGLVHKVDELIVDGMLELRGQRVRLTPRGRRYADSVAVALLSSLENSSPQDPSH